MGDGILYVDPSYKGTGLFLVEPSTRTFTFGLIGEKQGTMRSYANYLTTAFRVASAFSSFIEACQPSIVKVEIPPPFGQTSAGLTGLSFLLLDRIVNLPCVQKIELINPSFISLAQRKFYSETASRSRIAREFSQRQKAWVPGSVWVDEDLLDDNDVSTAYLFYVFEKVHKGTPFHTYSSQPSKPLTTTTNTNPTTTTSTTIQPSSITTTSHNPARKVGRPSRGSPLQSL